MEVARARSAASGWNRGRRVLTLLAFGGREGRVAVRGVPGVVVSEYLLRDALADRFVVAVRPL